jgi:hypothetical protein
MLAARHVLWVAEAALGRLRKTVPSGGLVDDGDGFVFLLADSTGHRNKLGKPL